jgi:hypothetical protein
MSLFQVQPKHQEPPARITSRSLLAKANAQLKARVTEHIARFKEFWDGAAKPSDIVADMGPQAAQYLALASESFRHIATLATIAGKNVDDVLPPKYYMPRLPLVAHEDGTVTVTPVEGLDDWGRPVVPPRDLPVMPPDQP